MALMKPAVIPEFFARLKKAMPEPKTELEYDNVYQLAGRRRAVGPGDRRRRQPRHDARCSRSSRRRPQMVALGERKLIDYIKTIGLFRTKAKNVIGAEPAC